MEARQQGEEAQGAASVTQVVMPKPELPIAPVASVFRPSGEMAIGRQCSACEQGMEDGKDSDEMSSVGGIQTKLTVGSPGDRYEQEADRMAAQVMRMSVAPDNSPQVQRFGEEDNPVQRWSLAQSITPVVHRRVDEQVQMRELVQRAFQAGGSEASGDLESRLNASKGGGSALAPEVRAFMEPRFGADFSSVRVHTGGEAVQMNRELGAQAFTHGSDVYFGAGKSPGNNELTAHELTHVVQQGGTASSLTIHRKTKGEEMTEKADKWLSTDAELKREVDVLISALKEIKRGKSVEYNKTAGIEKIGNVAKLLSLKPKEKTGLETKWERLVKERKSANKSNYQSEQKSFFDAMQSPLTRQGKSYPKSQAKYWLKNTAPQIVDIIYAVADAELPADQLYAYAQKEGLVDYTRDQINLSKNADPTKAQLRGVSTSQPIDGFDYLGLDDYGTETKKVTGFLPSDFDDSKVKKIKKTNEKGRVVTSGEFPNIRMALQALAAMLKRRRNVFQENAKAMGYATPSQDELIYWTYVYFNSGEFAGKEQLKKYKDKRTLSDWIEKSEYENAIKLLQSYKMLRDMKLF
jgi:hypothetical protein